MLKIIQRFSINQGNLECSRLTGILSERRMKEGSGNGASLSLSLSLSLWELWEEKLVGFSFSGDPEG
jgi:hypothetical protein